MIICISGKSGSGKSTLAKRLVEENKNAVWLDIDKVGHKALTIDAVKKELVKCFGTSILDEEKINRKKLGEIVFDSHKEMDKLTDITWKYMQEEIDTFLDENKDKLILLDWLLLPSTKYFDLCDIKILLDIPYEVRKQRAVLRDGINEEAFDLREKASINFDASKFDLVLKENNFDEVKRLVKIYE